MTVSLGVYAFVVSLVLVAAIAGGAVYISNMKQDLNVCKVWREWIKFAQFSKDAQLIKVDKRRRTAGLVSLGFVNSLSPKKNIWLNSYIFTVRHMASLLWINSQVYVYDTN